MYPSYLPLAASNKAEKARLSLNRNLRKVKRLDLPVLIGFTVMLLLMGLVVLALGVTSHIKLEEKEDAGLTGDILTDLRSVTIPLTVIGAVQTAQSIFALVSVTINKFPFLVVYLVTGILSMAGNIAAAGYAFYCREQTHDYVQEHTGCRICDVSHDVVFKYALPAMSVAMATFIIHCVTFVAIYRVIKYAYRKSELKAVEKLKHGHARNYMRPQASQWNGFGSVPPAMPPQYPPPFQYPSPPLSYLDTYPQVPTSGYNPYGYGSAALYGGYYPYEDVHRGMDIPGYALGGLNNFMLPDGTTVQENFYQPARCPKSDVYSWRSRKVPPILPQREAADEGRSLFMRNGEDYN